MDRKIVVTGATGFIGRDLMEELVVRGYQVIALTRNPEKYKDQFQKAGITGVNWDARTGAGWAEWLDGAIGIVNLAGENIASGLWTSAKKRRLLDSRINAGNAVIDAIQRVEKKPKVLIQSSAIGYYGSRGAEELTEKSDPGNGFLVDICQEWEDSVSAVEHMDVRLVILRSGIVLGRDGGAVSKFTIPFKLFFGGHLGGGDQWMSWIHKYDLINIIISALENAEMQGIFNATAPHPTMAKEFFRAFGDALNRPSWFHVPGFIIKVLFGEMGKQALLTSQKVLPGKLLDSGYTFRFPEIGNAFEDLLHV